MGRLRQEILDCSGKMKTLSSESSALGDMINHLRSEKEDLTRQREIIEVEVGMLRAKGGVEQIVEGEGNVEGISGVNGEVGVGEEVEGDGDGDGDGRTLLDVGGWIDAAVRGEYDAVS